MTAIYKGHSEYWAWYTVQNTNSMLYCTLNKNISPAKLHKLYLQYNSVESVPLKNPCSIYSTYTRAVYRTMILTALKTPMNRHCTQYFQLSEPVTASDLSASKSLLPSSVSVTSLAGDCEDRSFVADTGLWLSTGLYWICCGNVPYGLFFIGSELSTICTSGMLGFAHSCRSATQHGKTAEIIYSRVPACQEARFTLTSCGSMIERVVES